MGWFRRRRRSDKSAGGSGSTRADLKAGLRHLEEFVRSRHGVEAFVEPRTNVTETTVLLIAHDGEWTRRRVAGVSDAFGFGRRLNIPVYEVNLVGYPQRMRDYNERQKRLSQGEGRS
ncbi:MAG: hypothetical protein ACRDT8_04355 [Micromonosporaceae bacterium]